MNYRRRSCETDLSVPEYVADSGIDSRPRTCHFATMKLLKDLRAEHDLIDQMLDSFRTAVIQLIGGQARPKDLSRFITFFRVIADEFHHAREEEVLFAVLVNRLQLPGDRGPIAVMTDDHRKFRVLLDQLQQWVEQRSLSPAEQIRLRAATEQYIEAMQHHIDAENSVLFIEGEICLRDAGITELPSRGLTSKEMKVRFTAEDLMRRYPPTPNVEIIRGDGCPLCPAYQVTCDGYEREWAKVSRWGHAETEDDSSDW